MYEKNYYYYHCFLPLFNRKSGYFDCCTRQLCAESEFPLSGADDCNRAGVLYAFGQNKDSYKYGNQIGELNQNPTIATGMGVTYNTALVGYIPFARTLNSTAAAMHRVGAYGTVGVEIFLAPKISLGANINVYLFYDFTPAVENLYEGWNIRTDDLSLYRQKVSPAQHGVTFSTNNIGANLYLSFYL